MPWKTDRDSKLVQTLGAFGMLATRQIGQLIFPGIRKTTLCRRLRVLEKRGIIRRLPGLPDGTVMWTLTQKCGDELGIEGRIRRVNRNTLEHDLILADVRIALSRLGVVERWIPEHELKHQAWKAKYERRAEPEQIPDALVTVKARGSYKVMAVELERRMKGRARYRSIFINYLGMSSLWAVWYLVSNARMGKKLEGLWLEQPSYLRTARFLWSTIDDVLKDTERAKLHEEDAEHLLTRVLSP